MSLCMIVLMKRGVQALLIYFMQAIVCILSPEAVSLFLCISILALESFCS